MSPATPGGRSTPAGGGRVRGGRARTRRLLSVHERPVPRGYIVVDATESRPLVGSHSRRRLCVMEAPAERRCFKVQGPDRHVPAQTLAHRGPIFFFPSRAEPRAALRVIEPKVILLGVNRGGSIFTNPRSKTSMKSHPDPLLVSNLTAISMKQEIFDLFANRERRDVIG